MNRKREQPQCKMCGQMIPSGSGRRSYCGEKCRRRCWYSKNRMLRLGLGASDKIHPEVVAARAARVEQLRQLAEAGLPLVLPLAADLLD